MKRKSPMKAETIEQETNSSDLRIHALFNLPQELINFIFSKFSTQDLVSLKSSCKEVNKKVDSLYLGKAILEKLNKINSKLFNKFSTFLAIKDIPSDYEKGKRIFSKLSNNQSDEIYRYIFSYNIEDYYSYSFTLKKLHEKIMKIDEINGPAKNIKELNENQDALNELEAEMKIISRKY